MLFLLTYGQEMHRQNGETMESLISVIVPVYNTAQYLKRCITSIQNNTYKNLEIICINDGSTDNSLNILKNLATCDSRIKVITQPNGGVSSARNSGLDIATGDYVAFVDSDDWVHFQYFEMLIQNSADADIVVGNYVSNLDGNNYESNIPLPENITHQVIATQEAISNGYLRCSPCGRIYRRDSIDGIRFPSGIQYGEDAVFNVMLFSRKENIKIIRICATMYYYYNRPDSLVHSVAVDAFRQLSHSFLDCSSNLYRTDFMCYQAFRTALMYRYQGLLTKDKIKVKYEARSLLKKCLKYLLKEKKIAFKTKIELIIAASFASLYRWSLIYKDRSYLQLEQKLKNM